MEMGALQFAMRLIGSVGKLDQHVLRTGRLSEGDWQRFTDALSQLMPARCTSTKRRR